MNLNYSKEHLINKYGPLLGGDELARVLGYKTKSAFYRSIRTKTLGIAVFNIAGRKGKFALTENVANWLDTLTK